jgi:hypothetical protein
LAIALAAVFGAPKAEAQTTATATCAPLTQGFWKNHFPSAWGKVTLLTLGTTTYSVAQAEAILQTTVQGDASLILADQLIAALLNIQVKGTSSTTPTTLVADTITDANKLLGAGPIPEHIDPSSTIGQQMVADASILDNFNNGLITTACGAPPVGSCQPSSSLSALQSGTNVIAYVPKGSWSNSSSGVSVINVEGTLVTPMKIPTGSDAINSCASNSATGQTVCTANSNLVYFTSPGFTPVTLTAFNTPIASAGSGNITPRFSGGVCTNCGVAMDGVHNKAVIGLSIAGAPGFQYLDLGASLTFESAFTSPAGAISEDLLIDPIRNLLLSPAETHNFEILNVTTTTTPAFFENAPTGVGEFDSAGEDCSTGIALAPQEFSVPSVVFIADLTQATFTSGSPGSWTAPSQNQTLSESNLGIAGSSGIAVAQASPPNPAPHIGVVAGEFGGNTLTAIALPATSGSGIPAITDWVTCAIPDTPSGPFSNGLDPHTVTAYQSPNGGDAIALLASLGATTVTTVAVVDLTKMLNPAIVPRTTGATGGHACLSGTLPSTLVSFISVP